MSKSTCAWDGCDREAVAKGYCHRDYQRARKQGVSMPAPPAAVCAAEGCEAAAKSSGLCRRHYQKEWRDRQGPRNSTRVERPATCTIEGCEERHQGHGYCVTHYNRWKRHGDPLAPVVPKKRGGTRTCAGPECTRHAEALGLCGTHRMQQKMGRELTPIRGYRRDLPAFQECTVEGCGRGQRAAGMCEAHYQRARLGRDLTTPIGHYSARPNQCVAPGCAREVQARGLCDTHLRRRQCDSPAGLLPIGPPGRRIVHGRYSGTSYGVGWTKAKKIAQARDGYTCRACGTPAPEGSPHPVAHLVPRWAFADDVAALANHPANLIVLCRPCHVQFDTGVLTRYDYATSSRRVWPVWTAQPAGHKLHLAALTVCLYARELTALRHAEQAALAVLDAMPGLTEEIPTESVNPASFWDHDKGWASKLQPPEVEPTPQTDADRVLIRIAEALDILALYGGLVPGAGPAGT